MRNCCLYQALLLLAGATLLGLGACASMDQKFDEWFGVDRTVVETFDADEVSGRTDAQLVARYGAGKNLHKTSFGDGGLWVEVLQVKNDQEGLRIGFDLRLHNRFEDRIRFDVKDVVLVVDGEEYRASSADWYNQSTLEARGMNHRLASFQFAVGQVVPAGTYELRLDRIRLVDGPDEHPVGDVRAEVEILGKRAEGSNESKGEQREQGRGR